MLVGSKVSILANSKAFNKILHFYAFFVHFDALLLRFPIFVLWFSNICPVFLIFFYFFPFFSFIFLFCFHVFQVFPISFEKQNRFARNSGKVEKSDKHNPGK